MTLPRLEYDPAGRWEGVTAFPSHEAVICLRCFTSLGAVEVEFAPPLGCGTYRKRCPQCQLATSYDVSPQQASEIEYEEPDWRARFEEHCARWPNLPRYLQEDSAFEATLRDWRKWHDKDASTAMVALAALGIMPPRNLIKDTPRDRKGFEEQHDNHMWLTMSQRAWRILTIEDRIIVLDSFGEQTQIDLTTAKWGKYLDKAVEALQQQKEISNAK